MKPTEESLKEAKNLIDLGYAQVSRKYRTLARLPEGMTGIQAMINADKDNPEYWEQFDEGVAGDHYLRCYASDTIDVSEAVFTAFRQLGGGTYREMWWERGQEATPEPA